MSRRARAATHAPVTRARPAEPAPADALLPARGAWLDPRAPYLLPLVILLLSRAFAAWSLPTASEDAFITFRYARHLAGGHGLVYNPGEHVMGFTSPLWTIWMALGIRLLNDPVLWSRLWAAAADVVTLLLTTVALERYVSRASAWCFAMFFAGWFYFSAVAVSGMENGVMLALVVLSAALTERRHVLAGPALAALALSRPEGFAAALFLLFGASWRDRAIAAVLVAPALAALQSYYGSIVPQSLIAKAQIYGTPGPIAGRLWWEWLVPVTMGRPPSTLEGIHLFLAAVVFAPAAVLGARTLWPLRSTRLGRATATLLLIWLAYSLFGVTYFWWYLAVPLAGVATLIAAGVPQLLKGRALYVSLAVFLAGMWLGVLPLYRGRAQTEVRDFGGAADWLVAHAKPGQKVMLEPIGIVGWSCPLRVVDEVGLVSPAVAKRRLQGAGWFTDTVERERPDWLVVRRRELDNDEGFAGAGAPFRNAAERDSLMRKYEKATVIAEKPGPFEIWILERRP
jgi:hypothetical protein